MSFYFGAGGATPSSILKLTLSVASIVAVHGLNGHPTETWTHQTTNACWLKDFLPSDIDGARIMTFGYNAGAAFGNTTADVNDHAKDLLSSLIDKREEDEVSPLCLSLPLRRSLMDRDQEASRPLIFIAHSLGGIIVKKVSRHQSASSELGH